jgi:hypothetical protein
MEALLRLMATVAIVSCALPVLRARVILRKTTLLEAWRWGVLALVVWAGSWFVTGLARLVRPEWGDQLWMASAVFMISPFIAALGARRPAARVWSWFIVLPVTIVLLLPAVTAWNRDLSPAPLRLEVPMLAGYALVLLMGAGNYLGTRFVLSALLVAASCLSVIWPLSEFASRWEAPPSTIHAAATIGISAAAWLGLWQGQRTRPASSIAIERVWNDYRDLFGIVWARRVLDRVNGIARQEGWSVVLHFDGLSAADPGKRAEMTVDESRRLEEVLRWLLRRFVDPEWIDERLGQRP